ncbi:nicotinamide riboside transporter PnuC [soil metagenome]
MILQDTLDTISEAAKSTSLMEWLAIITALLYVVLAAKENAWCWLFGIISAGLYTGINFSIKLYLDAWLSVYYCAVGIYGWYIWVKKIPQKNNGGSLIHISLKQFCISTGAGIAGTFLLGFLSDNFTDSPLPYFDAALTSFSLVATFLTTQKILENWIFWVVIDASYILIYWNRALPFTAVLFLIYTFVAAYGYIKWRKKLNPSGG